MSSDTYDRATVEPAEESKGRLRSLYDTLAHQVASQVETVTRRARFEISGGNVDQVDAPEDLDELVALAKTVGFVWKSFDIFAQEVWEPGYRVEGPDETVAYFMGEQEDLDATPPDDTPEGGFLANCGIYSGEKHQDFYDVGKETTRQRRLRGTVLIERLKENPESPDSELTGFNFIRPETVSAEVYPNKNILIDPEDTDREGVETTKRGEAAAYIQFDDNSILGQRRNGLDEEEIPLSQNDVHKQVLNPGIGLNVDEDRTDRNQGIFGTSDIEPVKEDIAEYRNIKRNESTAIKNKAHGIYFIEHGREVLDLGNNQREIIEWDDDSMDDFEKKLDDIGPGEFITHDGSVTPDRIDGDVPDLEAVKQNYINDIFSALPIAKYKVGFEDDVNRDVTGEQAEKDRDLVSEEREYQERQWTKELKEVARRKGLPTDGLKLKIEPEPSDSPIMSLSTEEINKLATYADALNSLAGPAGGPQTLVDEETLLTDIAQLPESVTEIDEADLPEMDEDTLSDFQDIMAMGGDTGNRGALDFTPDLHPRDDEGKFTERGGSVGDIVELATSPPDSLALDNIRRESTLAESGAENGMFADQMKIYDRSDGGRVFSQDIEATRSEFGDRIADEIVDNSITASITRRELGAPNVTHFMDEDRGELLKEGVDGQIIGPDYDGATPNRQSFIDTIAAAMITGNEDVHQGNIMVDNSGEAFVVDYDRAGRSFRSRLPDDATRFAESVALDISEEEFRERAREMAEGADIDQLREALPTGEADRIIENIEEARS